MEQTRVRSAVLARSGCNGQSQLNQLLRGRAARAFEQIQHAGGLATVPRAGGLCALGRFLGRGGLLARLGFLWRNVARGFGTAGPWAGFRSVGYGNQGGSSASAVEIICFLLCWRCFRDRMSRSGWRGKQADSEGN
jgi:hypothetical protein